MVDGRGLYPKGLPLMQSISIGRFDDDPQAQGVIRPEDDRWQLVLDKEGYPHLYVKVQIENDDGEGTHPGMFPLDDLLPRELTVKDLMDGGAFGGKLTGEAEAEAYAEYVKDCEEGRRPPCPRK